MSGTSMDGLDIACCDFKKDKNQKWHFEIIASECIDYDSLWKSKLRGAHLFSGLELAILDQEFGSFIGEHILEFIHKYDLQPGLISSHGHTIFHQPQDRLSYQLGNGAAIYTVTGIPVV